MLERVKADVIQRLAQMRIRTENEVAELEAQQRLEQERRALEFQHAEAAALAQATAEQGGPMARAENMPAPLQAQVVRDQPKVDPQRPISRAAPERSSSSVMAGSRSDAARSP